MLKKHNGIRMWEPYTIGRLLEFYDPDRRYQDYYKINPLWQQISGAQARLDTGVVDRTGTIEYPFKTLVKATISSHPTRDSFNNVLLYSAQAIINNYPAPYVIYWSGGIDSTATVVAFKQLVPASSIIIATDEQSRRANPEFNQQVIKQFHSVDVADYQHQHGTQIHGFGADGVWGNFAVWNEPVVDWHTTVSLEYHELVERLIQKSHLPIETNEQLKW